MQGCLRSKGILTSGSIKNYSGTCILSTKGQMALLAEARIDSVPHVVAACVVLHNTCETLGDRCQDDWVVQDDSNSTENERRLGTDNTEGTPAGTGTPTSRVIRDAFAD